jgi:ADP-heptose:LPS heptosyltransferase
VEQAAAPVLDGQTAVDELIVLARRRGIARIRDDLAAAARLRRARFDVAIDLHGGPRSGWLTWATRAPMRIGYLIAGRAWMYTHVVARDREPSVRHSVLNQWELLAPLGITGPPRPEDTPVQMAHDGTASAAVASRLQALGIGEGSEIVTLHVSASNPFKRWPAASFAAVVARLLRGHTTRFAVILSGPSEPEAAHAVAEAARSQLGAEAVRVSTPQLSLPELRALIERSTVYIGGDSGPMHVAATTRTPIVELLGPTLASRSFPWRSPSCFAEIVDAGPLPCRPCTERVCVPGDFRCLTSIPVERVVEAAERALAFARPPGATDARSAVEPKAEG